MESNYPLSMRSDQSRDDGHLMPRPLYLQPGSKSPLSVSIASGLPLLKPGSSLGRRDSQLRTKRVGWTARENEMYKAETRLLFATESYLQVQKWRVALEAVAQKGGTKW